MKNYGLIGYPLSHSFSPTYFAEKFEKEGFNDHYYEAYPIEDISEVRSLFHDHKIYGCNVTIPHKEAVIPFLDEVRGVAADIQAVNTIKSREGRLIGYNTDVYGFRESLSEWLTEKEVSALILGTGGASKAIKAALNQMDIDYRTVSRTQGDFLYEDIDAHVIEAHRLIINTTPLGMYPDIDTCPDIPYEYLSEKHFLYDIVYNPKKTVFLKRACAYNAKTKNGLEMLHLQAEESWRIWNQD